MKGVHKKEQFETRNAFPSNEKNLLSEELYRLLFKNSNDSMFVSLRDADNTLPGKFIEVNDIACLRLGYTRDELLQMGPLDISVSLPTIPGTMKKLMIDKSVIHEEVHITKDGREIPVEISTRIFELNGRQFNLSIARDITERKQFENQLKVEKQKYLGLINNINGIVWEADPHTFKFSFISRKVETLLGYPAQQWIDEPNFWEEHIHPEDRERAVGYCVRCTKEMMAHDFEYRMIAADERIVWLQDFVTVDVENNDPIALHGLMVDITKHKRMEEELRKSEEENRAIINAVPDLLFQVSKNGVILDFLSDRNSADLYTQPELFLGKKLQEVMPPHIAKIAMSAVEDAIQTKKLVMFEYELDMLSGSRVFEDRIVPLSNDEVLSVVRDVTDQRQMEKNLKRLGTQDALTGLYNRSFFEQELARFESEKQFPLSFVMVDVDRLKDVNDNLGHAMGDELLKRTAQVLKIAFRSEDIIARIGGDEFAVILPNTNAMTAENAVLRVRHILQKDNDENSNLLLSISLGISTVDNNARSLQEALKDADARMYQEKQAYPKA